MGAALTIRRDLMSAEGLRRLARREQSRRTATRMLALAHALEGTSRAEAARLVGLERCAMRESASTPKGSLACATGRSRAGRRR